MYISEIYDDVSGYSMESPRSQKMLPETGLHADGISRDSTKWSTKGIRVRGDITTSDRDGTYLSITVAGTPIPSGAPAAQNTY